MNASILECQIHLDPSKPAKVTSSDLKEKLKTIGWVEDDPIPSGLAEYTKAVLKVLKKPNNTKNCLSIFDLEEVKVTLLSAIRHTKEVLGENNAIEKEVKKLVPDLENMSEAVKAPLQEIAEQEARKEIAKKAKNFNVQEEDEFKEEGEEIPEPKKEELPVMPPLEICPRCGLHLKDPYSPVVVSDEDRDAYLYAVLGGTVFEKEYKAMNDHMKVTFKGLTTEELNMINDQMRWDMYHKRILTELQRGAIVYRYSLFLSIKDIEIDVNIPGLDKSPKKQVTSEEFQKDEDTNLYKYMRYLEKRFAFSEAKYSIVSNLYEKFYDLYGRLHNELLNPNFWKYPSDNA